MSTLLQGRTVALAEGRQLEELAQMLEKEGATALRCPLVSMLDAPNEAPVLDWLSLLIGKQGGQRFDYVILMTGEGVRRLLGFADRAGIRPSVIEALGQARLVTRGPKPVRALKDVGLNPTLVAPLPTTEGVIATLRKENLEGKRVGVQLAGVPNPPLAQFLETARVALHSSVLPYVYAPAADAQKVVDLLRRMAAGTVDAICFTSSPQVDRLYEVASEQRMNDVLQQGLGRVKVAAVGPVVADRLREHGREPDICPEQGFVMKNLVQLIKRGLTGQA